MLLCTAEGNKLKEVSESKISKTVNGDKIEICYIKEPDRRGFLCIIYNRRNAAGDIRKIKLPRHGAKLVVTTPYLLARYDYGEYADIDMEDVGYYMLALEAEA